MVLDEKDLDIIDEISENTIIPNISDPAIEIKSNEGISSTAERGTWIHHEISKIIDRNMVIPKELHSDKNYKVIYWVIEKLRPYVADFTFSSESPIKFSIFGYMISGIPDLILNPKISDKNDQIWDFKTGKRKPESESSYWFQLMAYAYGIGKLKGYGNKKKVKLVLAYVDENILVEKEYSLDTVKNKLFEYWNKLDNFSDINLDHCGQCKFGNICHFAVG